MAAIKPLPTHDMSDVIIHPRKMRVHNTGNGTLLPSLLLLLFLFLVPSPFLLLLLPPLPQCLVTDRVLDDSDVLYR